MPRRDRSTYSRAVRWLKIGLPLVALGLLSALFLWPKDTGFDFGLIYSTADLIALGEGLSVSNPRFAGSTEDGEPFLIRADSATPDQPDPELVTLDAVQADLDRLDGRNVRLTAASGALRPKANTLTLEGRVKIVTSDGYEVRTERIEASMRDRALQAPGAVRVEGPDGSIAAGSFRARRISEKQALRDPDGLPAGDYFWFENRVKVNFLPRKSAR